MVNNTMEFLPRASQRGIEISGHDFLGVTFQYIGKKEEHKQKVYYQLDRPSGTYQHKLRLPQKH